MPGGEWGNGAMGNAVWKGARLKDILDKAGLEADAVQVRLNGAEGPVAPATDPLWREMLAGRLSEREYWRRRAAEVGRAA